MWKSENQSRRGPSRRGRDRSKRAEGKGGGASWLYSPAVYKRRFCAHYPDVGACKRGDACAFAHSREEFRGPLLPEDEENSMQHSDDFYMYCFKTVWCPIGQQHDWQQCIYAHNYLDVRRNPLVGYGCRACPHWDKKASTDRYDARCPLGVRCPYAHGPKEQLYHPAYYKSIGCLDARTGCPRGDACAFHHGDAQRSVESTEELYTRPVPVASMALLQPDFCSPPTVGGPEKKELPFLQAPRVDLSADLPMPTTDSPQGSSPAGMPMFMGGWAGSPGQPAGVPPQVGEEGAAMPMFVLPMGMPPFPTGSPGSFPAGSPPMFAMPSPGGTMPGFPQMFLPPTFAGLPDLSGFQQGLAGMFPMPSGASPPFYAAQSPAFGAQPSPLFGAQRSPTFAGQGRSPSFQAVSPAFVPQSPGACASPSGRMMFPSGEMAELPMISSPAAPASSPGRVAMTPLQRYTQDILNADGDCFDLDVEKFTRLSDTDSTELPLEALGA